MHHYDLIKATLKSRRQRMRSGQTNEKLQPNHSADIHLCLPALTPRCSLMENFPKTSSHHSTSTAHTIVSTGLSGKWIRGLSAGLFSAKTHLFMGGGVTTNLLLPRSVKKKICNDCTYQSHSLFFSLMSCYVLLPREKGKLDSHVRCLIYPDSKPESIF